eukprot:1146565-Pelagomonas_calceolata.AAC.1
MRTLRKIPHRHKVLILGPPPSPDVPREAPSAISGRESFFPEFPGTSGQGESDDSMVQTCTEAKDQAAVLSILFHTRKIVEESGEPPRR